MHLVEFGQRLEDLSRSVDTTIRLGLTFVVAATGAACETTAAKVPTKAPQAQETQISIPPTLATTVAAAVATPEATTPPSPTATETQVPPTPTGTATREASPTTAPTTAPTKAPTKEAEKPPLLEYAVFTGSLLKKETQEPIGTIVVSQLPKPVNQILVFFVVQRSGRPFLMSPRYISPAGTVFENAESRYEYVRIDASKPGVIFGALEGGNTRMTFTAQLSGQGRDALIQIYKQTEIKEYNRPGITDQSVINELAQTNITLP